MEMITLENLKGHYVILREVGLEKERALLETQFYAQAKTVERSFYAREAVSEEEIGLLEYVKTDIQFAQACELEYSISKKNLKKARVTAGK